MPLPQAQLFEDEFPLLRTCPALNEIRLTGEIKGLTIEVKDGAQLHAHRIILAARIPSFRATLSGPLEEENSVIRWPTVPVSLATALLNYAYTGQMVITQTNVEGIVMFSRMVKLPVLENWGVQFLLNNVNLENLAATWDIARSLNVGVLTEACIQRMREGFESFIYSDLFVRLSADTVLSLLQSDSLPVNSEEQILAAISRWICPSREIDDERLKLHAPAMLKEVQWDQTTVHFRKRLLECYPMFTDSPGCARLILSVEQWIGAVDRDELPCPFTEHKRPSLSFYLFGKDQGEDRWSVLRFDSHLQNEERVADMEMRYGATYSAVGEESIFVVGGQTTQQIGSTCVDEFLVKEGRWLKRAPLAIRRRDHAVAVVKVNTADRDGGEEALICVFGGSHKEGDTWTRLSSCEIYDVNEDRWHKLPDLREKRNAPAAACLPGDNRVFIFGGMNNPFLSASVEFCHLRADWRQVETNSVGTEDFWLPAAPMRNARAFLSAAHFKGRIIAAGGQKIGKAVDIVEMFSPPDAICPLGQWTELARMQHPRSSPNILTVADTVFVLGSSKQPRNTVEALSEPEGPVDFSNDLTSWIWSSKGSVEALCNIVGAAKIRT
ncbi:protein homodimerization activity [Sparganum proliferum]